ncbi:MAG: hypothetical protein JRN06_07250 [Nitrososphaerota archaeon]|nr:hypothetical protein [Nitrososphaerota archaeon]MDG7024423.1 hypothetical protein [Nitrososphaerota archaeon]
MPRCANGHLAGLALFCGACGAPVLFEKAVQDQASIPKVDVELEETAVLFAGLPQFPTPGAFSCRLEVDTKGEKAVDRLSLKQLSGGAWPDYCRAYRDEVKGWLGANGFLGTPRKLVVLDLSGPTSVLLVSSLPADIGAIVVGIAADGDSTPVEQNATYVAMEGASRRRLPMVVVPRGDVSRMTCYRAEEGLVTGYPAFVGPLSGLMEALTQLQDSVYSDARLGVVPHLLAAVVSASDAVYRTPAEAAKALRGLVLGRAEGVSSVLLVGSGPRAKAGELERAFGAFNDGIGDLIASRKVSLVRGEGDVYDIIAVAGVEKLGVGKDVKKGYETIAEKDGGLGVEGLQAFL